MTQWVHRFQDELLAKGNHSPTTVNHYCHDLDLFVRFLHTFAPYIERPHSITQSEIEAFLNYMALERGNNKTSLRRRLISLRVFFRHLIGQGFLTHDPTSSVKTYRPEKKPPVVLSRDEALRLLEATKTTRFPQRDYAIFHLFLSCGCTLSEVIGLSLRDIDPHSGIIFLRGRSESMRVLPMPPGCREAVLEYAAIRPKAPGGTNFFLNRFGEGITKGAIYYAFRHALNRAEINKPGLSIRSLKYTCIALLWEAGVSLYMIQRIAGHTSLASIKGYSWLGPRGDDPLAWRWRHPLDG